MISTQWLSRVFCAVCIKPARQWGYPYAIFNGRSLRYLGAVFGNVIREASGLFNGWGVVECFAHLSAWATAYGVFAFSGSEYAKVSSLELPASLVARLLEQ